MQNHEISGVAYQQGELAGYKVGEYLLVKWGRKCAHYGVTNIPLVAEHDVLRTRGDSDQISYLTLTWGPCNQKKSTQTAEEFGYPKIQEKARLPLKDTTAINATRWALYN